jgi:superfamily II DNA/RNA helicase
MNEIETASYDIRSSIQRPCSQVRFVHEMFKRMRPGLPVAMLHGRMKQKARMGTFQAFCQAQHTVRRCKLTV